MWLQLTHGAVTVKQPIMPRSAALALWSQWHIVEKFRVIQLPSAPTEAARMINIRFNIYTGTYWVRLNFFLIIELELELELEQTSKDYAMF